MVRLRMVPEQPAPTTSELQDDRGRFINMHNPTRTYTRPVKETTARGGDREVVDLTRPSDRPTDESDGRTRSMKLGVHPPGNMNSGRGSGPTTSTQVYMGSLNNSLTRRNSGMGHEAKQSREVIDLTGRRRGPGDAHTEGPSGAEREKIPPRPGSGNSDRMRRDECVVSCGRIDRCVRGGAPHERGGLVSTADQREKKRQRKAQDASLPTRASEEGATTSGTRTNVLGLLSATVNAKGAGKKKLLKDIEYERECMSFVDSSSSFMTCVQTQSDIEAFLWEIQQAGCLAVVMTAILVEHEYYLYTLCDPITGQQKANLKSMRRKKIITGEEQVKKDGEYLAGIAFLTQCRESDSSAREVKKLRILPFGPLSYMVSGSKGANGEGALSHASARDGLRRILACRVPIICFQAQSLQRVLLQNQVAVPRPSRIRLLDPALMTWMSDPELKVRPAAPPDHLLYCLLPVSPGSDVSDARLPCGTTPPSELHASVDPRSLSAAAAVGRRSRAPYRCRQARVRSSPRSAAARGVYSPEN